ncbi:PAS and ANTAR domain-containing protein [Nocardia sp. BMG111209]|uniref:PAS and ANTAR domain-containing protein n=1 Tax=Nocardia sp. BMG111209 TaxID=1160137 RepID=UPI000689B8CC|nr:PAS and ANTAR domain-containing protein [Nocardia sp. BMG111209]
MPGRAAEIIAAGRPQAVGSFSFWFDEQRWEWSDEVARMHGYQPDAVEPTTELLLAHKHPDDRAQVAETIARSLDTGEPFSSRHRFLDTTGVVHHVIVVADRILDDTGTLVGTAGYYIDVTDTLAEQRRETLTDTLPEVVEARAVIEQVKGILMYVYRIDSDRAFDVLRWRSQETNMKLRDLAGHLLAELHTLPSGTAASRSQFDHLLLTAHLHHDGQATTGHM